MLESRVHGTSYRCTKLHTGVQRVILLAKIFKDACGKPMQRTCVSAHPTASVIQVDSGAPVATLCAGLRVSPNLKVHRWWEVGQVQKIYFEPIIRDPHSIISGSKKPQSFPE